MPPVRVRVRSDDPLARSALTQLLADRPEVAVVDEAPEVVVWDFASAESTGGAGLPIVAVLGDESQGAEALAAGARGLVSRGVDSDRLAAAVLAVASGLIVLDDGTGAALLRPAARSDAEAPLEELTPRELEVLQLLAEGLTNKRIAERLAISEHTAKFHVNAILGKLGARSRTEAIVLAARRGLVIL
jgi:two-component system, NarL family, nitrate/nitrite response regulator NarL